MHKGNSIAMTHIEIWLIALSLAMDCFTVSIAGGMFMRRVKWFPILQMAFLFGLFQAVNPLLGWLGTDMFKDAIERVDHWIAFAILLFLGVRMIKDSFNEDEESRLFNPEKLNTVVIMAVATSIDAFAVGISFSCMGLSSLKSLAYPLGAIGLTAFFMTVTGLFLGINCSRNLLSNVRPEMSGGIVLIIIGIKVLCEHTLI